MSKCAVVCLWHSQSGVEEAWLSHYQFPLLVILAGVKAGSEEELEVKHEGKLLMMVIFYDYP